MRVIGRILTPVYGNSMEQRAESRKKGMRIFARMYRCEKCGRALKGMGAKTRHEVVCQG